MRGYLQHAQLGITDDMTYTWFIWTTIPKLQVLLVTKSDADGDASAPHLQWKMIKWKPIMDEKLDFISMETVEMPMQWCKLFMIATHWRKAHVEVSLRKVTHADCDSHWNLLKRPLVIHKSKHSWMYSLLLYSNYIERPPLMRNHFCLFHWVVLLSNLFPL